MMLAVILNPPKWWPMKTLFARVILPLALLMSGCASRPDASVGLHQEIQYDDFGFTALDATRVRGGTSAAPADIVTVTLNIANHARRVDFRFDRAIAILTDDEGDPYRAEPLDAAATASDACYAPLAAGATCKTALVYRVPSTAKLLSLTFSFGGNALTDQLDRIFWPNIWKDGHRRIALR
jgi:hypothetical protein